MLQALLAFSSVASACTHILVLVLVSSVDQQEAQPAGQSSYVVRSSYCKYFGCPLALSGWSYATCFRVCRHRSQLPERQWKGTITHLEQIIDSPMMIYYEGGHSK